MDTSRFAVPLETDSETLSKGPAKAPAENGATGPTLQAEGKETKEGAAADAGQCRTTGELETGDY